MVKESGLDRDEYDKKFNHVIIRDRKHRSVVECFRYTFYTSGSLVQTGYSAVHYDERRKIDFIFGRTSFEGIDHGKYLDCFAILR